MGRVRDVRQGPDGYIYVAIDGNERGDKTPIYRLEPADESQTSDSTGRQKKLGLESFRRDSTTISSRRAKSTRTRLSALLPRP
jgi:hypothetical protein